MLCDGAITGEKMKEIVDVISKKHLKGVSPSIMAMIVDLQVFERNSQISKFLMSNLLAFVNF